MRVETNINKLGDKILSGRESIAKAKEEDFADNQRYRLDDQAHLANVAARLGKPMSHTELISKVSALTGHTVWAEESQNWLGGMNFYTERNGQKVCLAAPFEKGWIPENSYVIEDEMKLPAQAKRGWRTVLYRLIAAKVLTKQIVDKHFGRALEANESHVRWNIYTRNYN